MSIESFKKQLKDSMKKLEESYKLAPKKTAEQIAENRAEALERIKKDIARWKDLPADWYKTK
jgi:inorganic pyrophosphatase